MVFPIRLLTWWVCPRIRTGLPLDRQLSLQMQVFSDFSRETCTGTISVGWFWGQGGGNQWRGGSVPTVIGSVLKLFSIVQALHGGLWRAVGCKGFLCHYDTRNYRKLQAQGGGNTRYVVSDTYVCRATRCTFIGFAYIFIILYTGADKSLARPDWKKPIESSPFFVRRGGHCCRGDLVGRTAFWFFFLSDLQK